MGNAENTNRGREEAGFTQFLTHKSTLDSSVYLDANSAEIVSQFPVDFTLLSFSASSKESVTHCRTQIKLSKMGDTGNASSSDRRSLSLKKMEEIYQCPVCLNLPICNIYQCSEGHLVCADCYNKMPAPTKCPTCKNRLSVPPTRCRTAEQVIQH